MIETFGKPCHSANPEKGINAVYKMAKVIEAIRTLEPTHHPVLGDGILELTDIKSAPYPGASVVPEYCRATYDRRLLVGETKESVLAPINALLEKLMAEDPELKVKASYAVGKEMCHTGNVIEGERFFPGWLYDENDDFVQAVYGELKAMGYHKPFAPEERLCTQRCKRKEGGSKKEPPSGNGQRKLFAGNRVHQKENLFRGFGEVVFNHGAYQTVNQKGHSVAVVTQAGRSALVRAKNLQKHLFQHPQHLLFP